MLVLTEVVMYVLPVFLDLPELIGMETGVIESEIGDKRRIRLVCFRWHERDHWVTGRMVWLNVMTGGQVFVRPVNSTKVYSTCFRIAPDLNPPSFFVHRPVMKRQPLSPEFVFEGFPVDRLIDIDFVRAEGDRLASRPWGPPPPEWQRIERPRSGLIV
jgi:hypothetical protein